jgi:hypothetical protein
MWYFFIFHFYNFKSCVNFFGCFCRLKLGGEGEGGGGGQRGRRRGGRKDREREREEERRNTGQSIEEYTGEAKKRRSQVGYAEGYMRSLISSCQEGFSSVYLGRIFWRPHYYRYQDLSNY